MMTVSKELADAIRMFSGFFDSIGHPVAIIDDEGRFVYYNQESAIIDGSSREEALGRRVQDMYSNIDEQNSTMLQALQHQKHFINKYQLYINAAGKQVHYVFTTLPINDSHGQAVGAIEVGRDLSLIHTQHHQVMDLIDRLAGGDEEKPTEIISGNAGMRRLIMRARRLAGINIPVLIYGETGTGKELFAKLLHSQSPRANKPFLVLNCAAVPENLMESTLFGTVRGAFTGAEDRRGILEAANGGTLFLDELNSMPLAIQGKLLRVLQEHRFCRVGSNHETVIDIHFIAATNQSPQQMLEQQIIRSDLLYRLNVGYLAIPPLRERGQDVRLLAQFFVKKHADITQGRVTGISEAVLARLERHAWPGNVRMLENVILRSLVLSESGHQLDFILLDEEDQASNWCALPAETGQHRPLETGSCSQDPHREKCILLETEVSAFERGLLVNCLSRHPNLTEAARYCGIPRTTLQYKMKKHGIRLARTLTE